MRILSLSGWGQPHDALKNIVPDALHLDYAPCKDAEEALAVIAEAGRECDMVIGWSLGAQLALRAIAQGRIRPAKLVLIAPPYQFVENTKLPMGMKRDMHEKFYHNYKTNPERTLTKAWELIIKDDEQEDRVRAHLSQHDKQALIAHDWQLWLDELERFSCDTLPLDMIPSSTLIVHGNNDLIIGVEQSRYLKGKLPRAMLIEFLGCGHAPHWHDPDTLVSLIKEHADV